MGRDRKENRTGRRIRRAAKDTSETKRGPKRNLRVLREMANVILRPSSVVFERSW